MTDRRGAVVAGVDAHTDEHHVAVLDQQGRLLGASAFPTTAAGYSRLIAWLRRQGPVDRVGVESTGAYAAGLVRALLASGIRVVEVNQPHPHSRQRLGKSDPIDAELAARAALSRTATAVPKQTGGIVEGIRQLSVARAGALKARTAALQQLDDLVITAPEQLRSELRHGRTLKARAALCLHLRPDMTRLQEPLQAGKLALRSLARRVRALDHEILELDANSSSSSPARPRARSSSSESAPRARANCSSPPGRTSTGSTVRPPSPSSAAPPRSKPAAAAARVTGSTTEATDKPTEPCA
jgi:transposase